MPDDLTGRCFNSWTVVGRDWSSQARRGSEYKWWCRCVCGNRRSVSGYHLRSGRSTRCRQCAHGDAKDRITSNFWSHIKDSALKRGLAFNITKDFAYALFQKQAARCALTNAPLRMANTIRDHGRGKTTASLDRIDNSRGYEPDNVQWVHKTINRMRGVLTVDAFLAWCSAVDHNHRRLLGAAAPAGLAPCPGNG